MTGFVYAIRNCETGRIKIGFTMSLRARLGALRTASSEALEPIGYAHGTQEDEREAHDLFAEYRRTGEWFERSPVIDEFLARLAPWPDAELPRDPLPVAKPDQWRVNLAEAVDRSRRSCREISLNAGLGPNFVHQILKTEKEPSIGNFVAVARALNVPVAELVGERRTAPQAAE